MTADRKIRRLICDPTNHFSLKIKIMVLIFIIGTIASFLKLTSIDFMGFYIEIKEKYNLLSSDSVNCCSLDNLKVTELIKSIKFEVINQNEALDLIEEKLNKKTKVSSLAIIGSSGIGKTKFLLSLVKNFYWRENIQQHTLQNIDGVGNDVNLEKILNNLTKCGKNLIILDRLSTKYVYYINQFNEKVKSVVENTENTLLIIYIFNLSRYDKLEEEIFEINLKKLKNQISNSIDIINFRTFNKTDLYKCLEHECKISNAKLSPEQINAIIKTHDWKRSGCKNVQAKVLLYKYL